MQDDSISPTAYLDRLRVLAAFAVILLHVTLGAVGFVTPFNALWWSGHSLCLVLQWCVPLFIMISGALLLHESRSRETGVSFYRKRAKRIALPLIVWTGLYYVCRYRFDNEPVDWHTIGRDISAANPPYHTYFLFLIAILYGLTPLLRRFVLATTPIQRQVTIALLLGLGSLYALANPVYWHRERSILTFFLPYVGYYLWGHELHESIPRRPKARHLALIFLLCLSYTLVQSGAYLEHQGRFNGRFVLGFLSLPIIFLSSAVFRAVQASHRPWPSVDRLVRKVAQHLRHLSVPHCDPHRARRGTGQGPCRKRILDQRHRRHGGPILLVLLPHRRLKKTTAAALAGVIPLPRRRWGSNLKVSFMGDSPPFC